MPRQPARRELEVRESAWLGHRHGPCPLTWIGRCKPSRQERRGPIGSMRQVPEDFPQPSERETNGMLPKPSLHKRNGHRYSRRPGIRFASEMLGLVHHDPDRAAELSPNLVRFGAIVQSERFDEQWEQMLAQGMSLPSALARALTRTREAFERGELADVQVALEGLRAQASAAAEMIAGLTNAARSSERRTMPEAGRRLLSVNDVVLHVLAAAAASGPVSSQLDPRLPRVAADAEQINDLLATLLDVVAGVRDAGGRPGAIIVRTSHHDGVMEGERVVRVLITHDDAATLDQLRPVALSPVVAAGEPGSPASTAAYSAPPRYPEAASASPWSCRQPEAGASRRSSGHQARLVVTRSGFVGFLPESSRSS